MVSERVYLLLPSPAISGKGKQRLLAIYEISELIKKELALAGDPKAKRRAL